MKEKVAVAFKGEWAALRNPCGLAMLVGALSFAYLLQHYPQYATTPDFRDDAPSSVSLRWILVNGVSLYLLARLSGVPGLLSRVYISALVMLNITSILYFGSRLTYGAIESGFETNPSELKGLFVTIGFTPILVLAATFVFLMVCSARVGKTAWLGKTLLILTLLIIPAKLAAQTVTGNRSVDFLKWQRWPVAGTVLYYQDMITLSDLVAAGSYQIEKYRLAQESITRRVLPPGLSYQAETAQATQPVKLILIVGESAAKSHYGIYGYPFGADEFLQEAAKDSEHSFIATNALSPAAVTREALIRTLSFASPRDDAPFTTNVNVVELAKLAGYSTAWISNQKKIGRHDTPVGMMACTADTVYFQKHDSSGTYRGGHDMELLKVFDEVYKPDPSRQFIVMHLMGSHQSYTDRYDQADYDATLHSPPEFRAYDASVHQTDRVIRAIADRLKSDPRAVLVYLSDHGEIVNVGHGRLEFIREQYEIPLLALGSPKLLQRLSQSYRKYSSQSMPIFNTTNIIYMLAEGMGYSVDEKTVTQAVSDGDYFFDVDNQFYPLSQLK